MISLKSSLAIIAAAFLLAACSTPNEHVPFDRKGNNEDRLSATSDAYLNCALAGNPSESDGGMGSVAG